ncbi:porin family protein [Cesiribacter andamanensis]|uniref:Outer membrane protein beta-barrel domain-containing protein n=1 Tax=Cesiribacter andamanensis AMV16 TaxID=1279009 RepID=M7MW58_9BACT|nr:porin family protein [Cesiribacter andamanensis]EMR00673.1 hypothetical protein ADICEAN_04203 [Cesiribacter andamanensis AMV16]
MMKRFIFSLALLTFCVFGVQAQTAGVGLKAGLNLANIGGGDLSSGKTRTGIHAGLMGAFGLAPGVFLQPELQFSMQGEGVRDTDEELHLTYIHIPVMAKVMLGEVFNLQFGPYGSFRVGDVKGGDATLRESWNSFDAGVGLGLGVGDASGFTVDARYLYGLTSVNDAQKFEGAGNRLLQLSVGYFFGGNR